MEQNRPPAHVAGNRNAVDSYLQVEMRAMRLFTAFVVLTLRRWVDDYFSVEPSESVEHAMACFARLVRAVLGDDAISSDKIAYGNPLPILGLCIGIQGAQLEVKLTDEKASKWVLLIENLLVANCMSKREADRLAGRLSFASQNLFYKLGRAMLRPLFAHKSKTHNRCSLGASAQLGMQWWLRVLKGGLCQKRSLVNRSAVVDLFCDAASSPPRVAAILVYDGQFLHTDWDVPAAILSMFQRRSDRQIMGLELLAILLGTFPPCFLFCMIAFCLLGC